MCFAQPKCCVVCGYDDPPPQTECEGWHMLVHWYCIPTHVPVENWSCRECRVQQQRAASVKGSPKFAQPNLIHYAQSPTPMRAKLNRAERNLESKFICILLCTASLSCLVLSCPVLSCLALCCVVALRFVAALLCRCAAVLICCCVNVCAALCGIAGSSIMTMSFTLRDAMENQVSWRSKI